MIIFLLPQMNNIYYENCDLTILMSITWSLPLFLTTSNNYIATSINHVQGDCYSALPPFFSHENP